MGTINMTGISLDGIHAVIAIVAVYVFGGMSVWLNHVRIKRNREVRRLKKETTIWMMNKMPKNKAPRHSICVSNAPLGRRRSHTMAATMPATIRVAAMLKISLFEVWPITQ